MNRVQTCEYTPSHIANFFLEQKGHKIDNLKLNKIVYIALGFSLALLEEDLFEENVEAWTYGPVIPSLYHEFKDNAREVIDRLSCFYSYTHDSLYRPKMKKDNSDLNTLMETVYEKYGRLPSSTLVTITHKKGTPWAQTFEDNTFRKVIEKKVIKDYYKSLTNHA